MPARLELSYSPAIDVKKDITYGPSNRLRGVGDCTQLVCGSNVAHEHETGDYEWPAAAGW